MTVYARESRLAVT